MTNLEQVAELLRGARCAVALTGAGVSTASGIPDFRSPGTGIWSRVDPAEVAHIDAFRRDPGHFWSFYADRLGALSGARPNPAHEALARLEAGGFLQGLITQNIDRLHRRAGSRIVSEVHGSIERADCLECGLSVTIETLELRLAESGGVPACDCGAPLKPGVVLFGEDLPARELMRARLWAEQSDLMLVAGSSLLVWPVAGLPEITVSGGGRLVIFNRDPTPYDELATVVERGPVEEVLPQLADLLLDRRHDGGF